MTIKSRHKQRTQRVGIAGGQGIASAGGLQDRGAAAANFYVIKRTVMPAVLTEIAFISNPAEEKLLNTLEFQQKMAQGIYRGLDKFFAQAAKLGGR